MRIHNEHILITGASSGLGQALAITLSKNNIVIACGRNLEALNTLAMQHKNIHPLVFDVTDAGSIPALRIELEALVPHLDRVVMNAGDCEYVNVNDISTRTYRDIMEVNFFGWLNTLDLTLDLIKKSKAPHLIGISSQVVFAPFSEASAYGASKAAASYFLESARIDLLPFNIDTTIIYPGFIDTPLTQKNTFKMPFLMNVNVAADRVSIAIAQRRRNYYFPKRLRLTLLLSKFLPTFWDKKVSL